MDRKILETLYRYLPVIQSTCDSHGWDGNNAEGCPLEAITETRLFFDYLQGHIPLTDIPDLEDTFASSTGGISLLWETELDPVAVEYDTFEVTITGEGYITYHLVLESLDMDRYGNVELEPELCEDIIEYIRFFARKQESYNAAEKAAA